MSLNRLGFAMLTVGTDIVHWLHFVYITWFTESGAITQLVIKGHQIVVHGATSTSKNRGFMDPVHILMDPVHRPGPRRGSMDQRSMFCTFPVKWGMALLFPLN